MDALCLRAGIQMAQQPITASGNMEFRLGAAGGEKASAKPRNLPWGFTFPLRSFWPGSKTRYEPAIAVDDAVLVEEKEESKEDGGSWVLKVLHVKSLWKKEETETESESGENEDGETSFDGCEIDYDDDEEEERIEFSRESFSKLLQKVPLADARLYARLSYLGSLAYSIPKIKAGNLLRNQKLRFVTSSLEKKEQALKASEEEDDSAHVNTEQSDRKVDGENRISASSAYRIAASAASYLHTHTKSILRFNSSNSISNDNVDQDMASVMATTDSVTSVVAAKEEVKQAVADDLNSTLSSPCEWFVCDDDQTATRFFVIQGSESLASWQANLLFEPIQFEGLDVLVHRGIYEAAKGIYKQMFPEIRAHINTHGDHATFRFTGHSLGGSLSILVNLMLLVRGEVPRFSLLPVITFGSPSIICGGDRLLHTLGLPRSHVHSITMHRDIVPRAFSCNYPTHVAEFLKAVNGNFRNHPCLNKQKLLYSPMGEFLILQPDNNFSPNHHLLPPGSGLYLLTCPEKQIRAAQAVFLNSPHPLEILSDRSAYGSEGMIQRDHDMDSYLKSVRTIIRQELNNVRKAKRDQRRRMWWPLVAPSGVSGGVIVSRQVAIGNMVARGGQLNFSGMVQTGKESLKRFSTLVASQHMHLLVVLLFPATMSKF